MTKTQLAVVGGGPGGYAAAFLAADLGLKVTLIDAEASPGGVCTYRGCIPSKALLHVARVIQEARHAPAWGVEFGEPRIDLARLRGWKNGVIHKQTGGLGQLVKLRGVTYVQGMASIKDAQTILVKTAPGSGGGDLEIGFDHLILATGSRPATVPSLSLNSPRVLDSTAALDLADLPRRLLVIGGGYIGLELGSVYATLGSEVSIVEMTPGLLPGVDRDLAQVLAKRIEALCHAVMLETKVVRMSETAEGITVALEGPGGKATEQTFDKVLVAVGRKPNSAIPGLDRTRVEVDARGFVVVDAERRTAEPSIFAVGDLVGEPMLAHKASHEGRVAAEAAAGHKTAFAPRAIPAVVFTDPELAWCGLTETEAARQGRAVEVTKFRWGASGRATTIDRTEGLTKLLLDPPTGRVLGVGIVGASAGELISEGVLAVEMGALAEDLRLSIHPHPTLSETIMESAEIFFGQATHVYKPKKTPR